MSQRKKKPAYNPRKLARERLEKLMASIFYVQDMFTAESGKIAKRLDMDLAEITGTTELDAYKREQTERSKAAYIGLISQVSKDLSAVIVAADNAAGQVVADLKVRPWKEMKDAAFIAELALEHHSTEAAIAGQKYTGLILEIMQDYFRNIEFVSREVKAGRSVEDAKKTLTENIAKEAEVATAAAAEVASAEKETVDVAE
ncbi:hypothetical protein KWAN_50 [Erwinia phage vB_EamM_Kwan]|uniref:Uncharacterized protein n=1 Tax=Erwinia phage vB_EamM_Kwan TaxID=1883374 RepID=A0A1B2IDT3_9CAUD|nr:hypothetical protein BIZ80_gp249 [Erwinia phage vB_EamM_Kwan]ANZ49402.1 hypothetical protein KWAN_50 [Erwinia phage vB_EamM_Kwan]